MTPLSQEQPDRKSKRKRASLHLLEACPCDWNDYSIVHYCPLGCPCRCRDDAVALVAELVEAAWLDASPPIPAMNRWTKIAPPLSWFLFGMLFYNILPAMMKEARKSINDVEQDPFAAVWDAIGPTSEEGMRRVRSVRWHRAEQWLAHSSTRYVLCLSAMAFQVVRSFFASNFDNAKLGGRGNLATWCSSDSPALRTIRHACDVLRQPHAQFWDILRESREWTPLLAHETACVFMNLIGGVFIRCVSPFREWPFVTFTLLSNELSPERRERLLDNIASVRSAVCMLAPICETT